MAKYWPRTANQIHTINFTAFKDGAWAKRFKVAILDIAQLALFKQHRDGQLKAAVVDACTREALWLNLLKYGYTFSQLCAVYHRIYS